MILPELSRRETLFVEASCRQIGFARENGEPKRDLSFAGAAYILDGDV